MYFNYKDTTNYYRSKDVKCTDHMYILPSNPTLVEAAAYTDAINVGYNYSDPQNIYHVDFSKFEQWAENEDQLINLSASSTLTDYVYSGYTFDSVSFVDDGFDVLTLKSYDNNGDTWKISTSLGTLYNASSKWSTMRDFSSYCTTYGVGTGSFTQVKNNKLARACIVLTYKKPANN